MRLAFGIALVAVAAVAGCMEHGSRCEPVITDQASTPVRPLRNPDTLTCEAINNPPPCDPTCGPCPPTGLANGVFLPTWNFCGTSCDALDATACAARTDCRVVRDLGCAVSGACANDFVGCFPLDMTVMTVDCARATDGDTCSRSSACTAFHRNDNACQPNSVDCARTFALCMAAGASPGHCHDKVVCNLAPPQCATGTTAGVANGCFTGACIPNDLCEVPKP
jgi:hypothetical protein